MTRLYWRIFLAFWLVLIAAIVVTAAVNSIMFDDEVALTRADTLRGSLDALAEQAERRLRRDGVDGLRDWLRERRQERSSPPLLVIGPDGEEILGRPTPRGARMLQDFGSAEPGIADGRGRMRHRMASAMRPFEDADGNRYVMVVPPFRPRVGPWFAAPQARTVFPIVLVLISGLVCLLLARYLTRPIAAFRRAGQSIAAGDLGARVGPDAARRKDEFGALARDFDDMAGRVQLLVDSQQRLLRDVSHELRSPLARLQAAAGLIRQRGGDDANLERIEREIEVLDGLIGRILGYSRMQSRTSLDAEFVDVNELVGGVVDDASFEGRAAGRRVEFAPGAALVANVDPALLRSAVENVVRNALQYSVRATTVTVDKNEEANSVEIRIADDGPGVEDTDLPQLFEPFFTGRSTRAGAGIGLAIARRALELHGGTIAARNADGGGLVVTMSLPSDGGATTT